MLSKRIPKKSHSLQTSSRYRYVLSGFSIGVVIVVLLVSVTMSLGSTSEVERLESKLRTLGASVVHPDFMLSEFLDNLSLEIYFELVEAVWTSPEKLAVYSQISAVILKSPKKHARFWGAISAKVEEGSAEYCLLATQAIPVWLELAEGLDREVLVSFASIIENAQECNGFSGGDWQQVDTAHRDVVSYLYDNMPDMYDHYAQRHYDLAKDNLYDEERATPSTVSLLCFISPTDAYRELRGLIQSPGRNLDDYHSVQTGVRIASYVLGYPGSPKDEIVADLLREASSSQVLEVTLNSAYSGNSSIDRIQLVINKSPKFLEKDNRFALLSYRRFLENNWHLILEDLDSNNSRLYIYLEDMLKQVKPELVQSAFIERAKKGYSPLVDGLALGVIENSCLRRAETIEFFEGIDLTPYSDTFNAKYEEIFNSRVIDMR